MDRGQYRTLEPVPMEILLEEVARFQARIDEQEGLIEDLKEQQADAKKEQERWRNRLALIGRARRNGKPLFMLDGGELTDETPDEEEPPEAAPLFEGQEPAVETPVLAGPGAEPESTDKVFLAKGPKDEACEVRADLTVSAPPHGGPWYGRVDGKPIAIGARSSANAKSLIERFLAHALDWSEAKPEDAEGLSPPSDEPGSTDTDKPGEPPAV